MASVQFACLILCLTITDLVTTVSGLVGGLVIEAGDMTWAGSSPGCAAYYFISSWLLGLSNYLVVCLVCLLLVKRSPGFLARLHVSSSSCVINTTFLCFPGCLEKAKLVPGHSPALVEDPVRRVYKRILATSR